MRWRYFYQCYGKFVPSQTIYGQHSTRLAQECIACRFFHREICVNHLVQCNCYLCWSTKVCAQTNAKIFTKITRKVLQCCISKCYQFTIIHFDCNFQHAGNFDSNYCPNTFFFKFFDFFF